MNPCPCGFRGVRGSNYRCNDMVVETSTRPKPCASPVARAQREPNVAIGSRRPYGLQVVNGIYMAKPPESDAMKLAYEMRLVNYGFLAVARRLREVAAPMERRDGKLVPFMSDPLSRR